MNTTKGIIVTYKEKHRAFLFAELRERWGEMPALCLGKGSAALLTENYPAIVQDIRRQGTPVFLQHLHPFSLACPASGTAGDIECFCRLAKFLAPKMDRKAPWTAQCRMVTDGQSAYGNRDLTGRLAEKLQELGFTVSPEKAVKALSLTVLDKQAFLGVSDLRDNISRWCGGVLFYGKTEGVISRAAFKLEEAGEVFGMDWSRVSRAVDLGAAPGGWTNFLAGKGIRVDAVDPAKLDPQVKRHKLVSHYRMSAQAFARQVRGRQYDLIVNDMKMDTAKTVEIILRLLPFLKENGQVIATLKLPERGFLQKAEMAKSLLERHFDTVRLRHLYYNRSELTLFAKGRR